MVSKFGPKKIEPIKQSIAFISQDLERFSRGKKGEKEGTTHKKWTSKVSKNSNKIAKHTLVDEPDQSLLDNDILYRNSRILR